MRREPAATAGRETRRAVPRPQRPPPTSMLPPDIVEHEPAPARPAAARPRAEYAREQPATAPARERRARLPLPPPLPVPRPPGAPGLRGAAKAERSAELPSRESPEVLFVVSQDAKGEAELRRLIRREGGGLLEVRPLEPRAAREAVRQWRDRIPPSQRVSGGQRIRAQIPRRNLQRFLGAIDRHPRMQLLERQAAPARRGDRRERQAVEIRLYR